MRTRRRELALRRRSGREVAGAHRQSRITCEKRDVDDYGRAVAVCRIDDVGLGAELVRSRLALAYRQYGDDYIGEENEARAAKRGAWVGEFVPPWDERRGASSERPAQRERPSTSAPEPRGPSSTCRGTGVKGNINSEAERIYHVPGSQSYGSTIIGEAKGERWFCTEEQALGAGWRAPRGR